MALIARDEDDAATARTRMEHARRAVSQAQQRREELLSRHRALTDAHATALAEHSNALSQHAALHTLAETAADRWRAHAAASARVDRAAQAMAAARAAVDAFFPNPAIADLTTELQRTQANAPDPARKAAAQAATNDARANLATAHRDVARLSEGRDRITALTAQRDQIAADLAAVDADLDTAVVLRDAYHPTGVPAMKLRAAITDFNTLVQQQLEILSGGAMSIELSADGVTAKGTPKDELHLVITGTDGEPRYYDSFSGGQRQRIDWAVRAAAARLRINRTGTPMETFAIDEGWGSLDDTGIVNGAAMLHALSSDFCVLTVSHIPTVQELFPTVLEVRDQGGTSVVTRR
ncbi:hypothetical protein GS531_00715 [Rhodococcus hoagii]|nr:hypothetical protein [Prescottella equi]